MQWEINGTDEFADWFESLTEAEQDQVIAVVERLAELGPSLGRPEVASDHGFEISQYEGATTSRCRQEPSFALHLDPRREAILLVGGDKTGQ